VECPLKQFSSFLFLFNWWFCSSTNW